MAHVVDELLDGKTLTRIVRDLGANGYTPVRMPTIFMWCERFPLFRDAYTRARQWQAHALLDGAQDDAQGAHDKDSALAARVKADTKLKLAEKWSPERFGPRVGSNAGVTVHIETTLGLPAVSRAVQDDGSYALEVPSAHGALSTQGSGHVTDVVEDAAQKARRK